MLNFEFLARRKITDAKPLIVEDRERAHLIGNEKF